MSIFSIFHRRSPESIYDELALKIVLSSLMYRSQLKDPDDSLSANAGAEIAYFLLHVLDRQALQVLGPAGRNKVFETVSIKVLGQYCTAVLRQGTPKDVLYEVGAQMMNTLNARQILYSKC